MNFESLKIVLDGDAICMPDWAKAAVEIGAYARYASASEKHRLIVCCVVPSRDVFSALVGLGSVIAGGRLFRKGFSWEDLKRLEPGTEIFWKIKENNLNYTGVLGAHESVLGQTMVPVTISKPVRERGRWLFSDSRFRECVFSEEKLPSAKSDQKFEIAEHFYGSLGISAASKWLMTAGAEVRFVTNRAHFMRTLEGWKMTSSLDGHASSLDQLLILQGEKDTSLAKARVTPHLRAFESECAVSVIDGPLAFQRLSDIDGGSLVVVLERGELGEEHLDQLLHAKDEHSLECEKALPDFAFNNMPPTVEVAGYCLKMA